MADHTSIEWTDATWNPITGCSVVSPGCTNCYAMKLAGTRLTNHESRKGLTKESKAGPVWTGEVRFNEQWLLQPLQWTKPRMIFVCAHGDLFAEGVPDEWIDRVFAVMALAPQHTFQVLTKRPERMRDYLTEKALLDRLTMAAWKIDQEEGASWSADIHSGHCKGLPLPNVWLGVSVEDQARAAERIHDLLRTPAAIRWISAEPLLGPINLNCLDVDADSFINALTIRLWGDEIANWRGAEINWQAQFLDWFDLSEMPDEDKPMLPRLDWVVAGGESGPNARPMHPDWVRSLRDQCAAAGVPFLFKQWGEWAPSENEGSEVTLRLQTKPPEKHSWHEWPDCTPPSANVGKKAAGRHLDGVLHDGFPEVRHA